jgi:hypothetical protein
LELKANYKENKDEGIEEDMSHKAIEDNIMEELLEKQADQDNSYSCFMDGEDDSLTSGNDMSCNISSKTPSQSLDMALPNYHKRKPENLIVNKLGHILKENWQLEMEQEEGVLFQNLSSDPLEGTFMNWRQMISRSVYKWHLWLVL